MFKLRENNTKMAEELLLSPETKITTKIIKNSDVENSKSKLTTTTTTTTKTSPTSIKKLKKRRDIIDLPNVPIQLNNDCSIKITPTKTIKTSISASTSSKPNQLKNKLTQNDSEKFINNNFNKNINNNKNIINYKKNNIKKNNNENKLPNLKTQQQQQQQQKQHSENSTIKNNKKKIKLNSTKNIILSPKNLIINQKEMSANNLIETSSSSMKNLNNMKNLQTDIKNIPKSQSMTSDKYQNNTTDNYIDKQQSSSFNKFSENEENFEENKEEGYDDEIVNSSLDSTLTIDLNNCENDPNNDDDYNDEYDDEDDDDYDDCRGDNSCFNIVLKKKSFCFCSNPDNCITLKDILSAFNAPISEDQAWALIFQYVKLYCDSIKSQKFRFIDLRIPNDINNFNLHNDGSVHINCTDNDEVNCTVTSQKKILMQIGRIVFNALDFNLQPDEECIMSGELEEIIAYMTFDEVDDEGIERDSEDCDEEKCINTKELDDVIETCIPRVKPSIPEDHYKAVCRALVTEALELRIFLQKVFHGDTESLRIKADAVASKQELDKLEFNDWARFWMQVVSELRRGVRLKKIDNSRTPVEYELTPYEILMGDIRAKKYNLRKVMINGDIPPRVKRDAHAVILEFIRSRPPLKKASERKLPPPVVSSPSPREKLMDSIRQGRSLRHIEKPTSLKNRMLPPPSAHQVESMKREKRDEKTMKSSDTHQSPRTKQRLIKVDFSLLREDDDDILDEASVSTTTNLNQSICSQPIMPAYPITGYNNENNPNNINTVLRRTTYDLATQCESRRASMRRHTIVGCQSHLKNETHSVPPSRPDSRQSNEYSTKPPISSTYVNNSNSKKSHSNTHHHLHNNQHHQIGNQQQPQQHSNNNNNVNNNNNNNHNKTMMNNNSSTSNLTTMETWMKNSLDEHQWSDKISDRLSLTLEEIVHIRSVMTKAELEGLPVGVHVKEDVERRKVCFLCLKTRFSIFGAWGIQCKLCQRTVCSKCYTKMRIPTEHFRNVPVVLLSPSLMGSPAGSSTPSPSHHYGVTSSAGGVGNSGHGVNSTILDESFPKTLMERLLRSESDRKTRNTVGSAPSSPKNQRSNMSTPGSCAHIETSATAGTMNRSNFTGGDDLKTNNLLLSVHGSNKENNSTSLMNGTSSGCPPNRQVAGIMSRSMEGPRSLPMQSPARPYSNSSTLDRKNRFARAFTLSSSAHLASDQKDNLRGEMMAVCNDCRCLVLEIIRSSRQTRSSARNRALKNLTLDISPVYKD